jgi:hypothetical protein
MKDVLNKWEKDHLRPFFPWKLHFGEVFNRENSGFDIIIANPPYVDSETMVRADKKQRDEYCGIFSCARGNWDLFVIFIEKGLQLLNISGTISYIVPNKLVASNYTSTIRELLNSKKMIEIRDYSEVKVFKEVNVYPVVFIAQNANPEGTVMMTHMKDMESNKITNDIPDEFFYKDIFWDKYFVDKKILDLILKISNNGNLDEYFHEISSAATVSEAYQLKEYVHELDSKNTNFKKLINTGTIDPFVSLWGRKKTQYIRDSFIRPVIDNDCILKVNPTRLRQASAEKIIVGGMTKRVECIYDKGQYLAGKSTTVIYGNEKIDLRALVCILNSKMISFWYKVYFNSLSLAGGYLQIGNATVKKIPLALTVENNQTKLIELHDLITDLTKSDNYSDDLVIQTKVERYKDQIDQIVYRLYDLTPEEIIIIEESMR